ncbi:hypothetical protein D1007_31820 [Hordeum vulgare]|nr:hypothetical protein D1007_31820 [Hordeum vulgare]
MLSPALRLLAPPAASPLLAPPTRPARRPPPAQPRPPPARPTRRLPPARPPNTRRHVFLSCARASPGGFQERRGREAPPHARGRGGDAARQHHPTPPAGEEAASDRARGGAARARALRLRVRGGGGLRVRAAPDGVGEGQGLPAVAGAGVRPGGRVGARAARAAGDRGRDGSFVWAGAANLTPLRDDFPRLAGVGLRNNCKVEFALALDDALAEVARRVDVGLSCGCGSSAAKGQVFQNSGLRRGASVAAVDAGFARDALRGEAFLRYVGALAVAPGDGADRLDDAVNWQLQHMIQYGNRSLLASDSKFGTNKLKYPVHSILVFDQQKNAIPVAWIITPNFTHGEIHRWMGALYDRVCTKGPTWQLGGFIIDDPLTDVRTIREVFLCPVLISLWRVRHAWHKKLMNKCSDFERRSMMSKRLGEAISSICRGNSDIELFQAFLEDFIDCSGFVDYFKALWFPRLGASVLKTNPLATAEVASAIERYHHLLKLRLLNEADESIYQRADWLVHKLGTKVHSYYWLDEFSGKDSFSRYWRSEWKTGPNPWQQGLQIPDSDIVIEGNCARVVCQKHKEKSHAVLNPSSELALCDCSWLRKGNLCKHAMKSAKV